jgi:hypothetical protein
LIGRCDAREFILFFIPLHKDKETPPTKQHICKPLQASPANPSLQKSCFFAFSHFLSKKYGKNIDTICK